MNRQGVTTTQKGCCSACDKPIVGQVITALGRTWHPEHFTCSHCCSELGTRNFFERDGNPYCEPDYHNLFSPRCAYCNGAILDVRFEQITIEIEWKKIELIGLFHLFFFSVIYRNVWLLWTRHGTPSISSALNAANNSAKMASMNVTANHTAVTITSICLHQSVPVVTVPSWKITSQHWTRNGMLNASFAGWVIFSLNFSDKFS